MMSWCVNSGSSAAPLCAISRVGANRSSRASNEAWSDVGIASASPDPSCVAIASLRQDAALDYRLGQLLDEQRHAVGTPDDLVGVGG